MGAVDFIIIGAIVLVVGGAVAYIIKHKKRGGRCIGCPDGKSCQKNNSCGTCSGCHYGDGK